MPNGRVVVEAFDSAVLRGNAPGDPTVRSIPVYLPPSYDVDPKRRFPVVYVLSGFTGRGRMMLNDNAWNPPLDDRMNMMIARGECPEIILVLPDCMTRYGGSQYVNSSATGRYEDHLVSELVPFVDGKYRTLAGRDHRGVAGKSSGGYGAMVLGMRHPDVFGGIVCHSGDMEFDYCYRPDVPKALTQIQRAGGLEPWFDGFEAKRQKNGDDMMTLNIVAMSACYSPNPGTAPFGIDLPADPATSAWRDTVWNRWLEQDPLRMIDRYADALRSMKLLFLDCGTRDEWSLHHGARLFAARARTLGIPHQHEEFDDGHMNVQYRYEVSLPRIANALGAS